MKHCQQLRGEYLRVNVHRALLGNSIIVLLCLCQQLVIAQLPLPPKLERQVVWIQANTNNVTGYQLRWGTNILNIGGASNTTATIKLDEGINTLVLRAAGSGTNQSDPITNIVRLINYELLESTNGGSLWNTITNFTYAIENYKSSAIFKAKVNWIQP